MMAFGAKIKLSVNTSGASAFRSEIQKHVDATTANNPIRLRNFTISMTQAQRRQIVNELQTYLAADSTLVLRIGRIDATGAIEQLRQQLQFMLSGLNISGLGNFVNAEGMSQARDAATQWAAQMHVIEDIQRRLGATYGTALSGNHMIADSAQINEITTSYNNWMLKIEQLRSSKAALSAEELQNLQQEGIAIQQKIALIQSEQTATTQAAVSEEAAARKQIMLAQQQVSLKAQVQRYIMSNSRAYKMYGVELDGILHTLQSESSLTDEQLKQIRMRFMEIQTSARAAGASGSTFFETMRKGFARFGGWALITRTLLLAYRAFTSMIAAVKDLDSAMTELKKVTDLSERSYAKFLKTSQQLSQTIGATLADTVNATADFARLGYDLADATSLAEAALVYKNVGDGIDDISTASESLISTIKAFESFGESADNAMNIVDRFNEVGNNFAISSVGIGEALERSAASLAAAGNNLNESIGLVTGMNAVLQNPEKVGTALKTITMYLRAAKTEAEEAGESTDGMASSVSELREELLTLTKGRVDIMVDDTTFKSTYQIMKEMSQIWGSLSDVDAANIVELTGGKRNANAVTSLLSNFEDAEKAMLAASDAAGSALAENDKYLESIAGKLSVFQAKLETFSNNLIGSDTVKGVVDLGSGLLTLLDTLQQIHLLLPAIIISASLIMAQLNARKIGSIAQQIMLSKTSLVEEKIVSDQLAVSISGLNTQQQKLLITELDRMVTTNAISAAEKEQILATLGLAGAEGTLTAANRTLSVSFKSLMASIPVWGWIALAISGVITAVQWLTDAIDANKQASIDSANEIIEAYNTANQTYDSNKKALTDLREEFVLLSAGVDENGDNISLTADEYDTYLSLIEQIVDLSPDVCSGYDNEGRAIVNYKKVLDEAIASQEKYIKNERHLYLSKGKDIFDGKAAEWQDAIDELVEAGVNVVNTAVPGFFETLLDLDTADAKSKAFFDAIRSAGIEWTNGVDTWEKSPEKIIAIYEKYENILTNLENSGAFNADEIVEIETALYGLSGAYSKLQSITGEQANYLAEWAKDQNWYNNIPVGALDEFTNGLKFIIDPLSSYNENMKNAAHYGTEFAEAINSSDSKSIIELAKNVATGSATIEEYNSAIKKFKESFSGDKNILDGLVLFFDSLTSSVVENKDETETAINDIISVAKLAEEKFETLKKAFKDFSDAGYVSASVLEDIKEKFQNVSDIDNYILKIAKASNTTEFENSMKDLMSAYIKQSGLLEELGGDYDAYIQKLMTTFGVSKNAAAALAALNSVELALNVSSENFDASNLIQQLVNVGISAANASGYVSALGRLLNAFNDARADFKVSAAHGGFFGDLAGMMKGIEGMLDFGKAFIDNADDLYTVSVMLDEIDNAKNNILDSLISDVSNYYDSDSSKSDKETDEYIAELDEFYKAKQKILAIQEEIAKVENEISLSDSNNSIDEFGHYNKENYEELIEYHKQLIALYKKEIEAQAELNNERDSAIQKNVDKLRAKGFIINYDPSTDYLYIANQERINDLKGKDIEATNALRKEYEQLIEDTIKLNDENKDTIENINNLTESIMSEADEIESLRNELYQSDIGNLKFEISIAERDGIKGEYLLSYWTNIIKRINKEIEYYLESGYDITSDTIQELMNELWQAEDEVETIIQSGYDKVKTALDDLSDYYTALTDAADEFASTGFITAETLETVLGFGAEYMKYLFDETGAVNFNREAIERLIAAKMRNYAISQAQAFLDEVKKNEGNAEALRNLADATYEANDAALLYLYTQINALNVSDELKDRYREIIDGIITMGETAVDSIGHTVEEVEEKITEQQDSINTIIDLTKDYIKQQAQDEIDNLNEQIEKYNEIVDLKKEQLSLAKEEAEYEKEVSDSVKSIAELQAEIDQLSLDDSIEAQSKRNELIDQLNAKQSELADKQEDYAYDEIVKALDESKDTFKSIVQKQIEAIEDSISSEQKLHDAAIKLLELDWNGTMTALKDFNYNMGSLLTNDLELTIKIATDAVDENGGITGAINNTGASGSNPELGDDSTNNIIADGTRPSEVIDNAGKLLESIFGQFGDIAGDIKDIFDTISGNNFVAGDINGDGKITAADARLALRSVARLESLTEEQAKAADINGDGKITAADARAILRAAAKLDDNSIASMTAEDISKSLWAAIELGENSSAAQYAGALSQKIGMEVYQSENGEWYVMTPTGSRKLFDLYPKYHTGGIAGDNLSPNDKEIFAILEKGELVLNEQKKEGLYEIVDFVEAIGRVLNIDARAIRGFSSATPVLKTVFGTQLPFASNNNVAFAPNIEVHIDSFRGTEDDAKTAANIIGKTAMDYMYREFNKRGVSSIGRAFLKK